MFLMALGKIIAKSIENLTLESIIQNPLRKDILTFCSKEPQSITDLEIITGVNRGTLKHHIKILEASKLIEKKQIKNKKGKPTQIKTLKENFKKALEKIKAIQNKRGMKWKKELEEEYERIMNFLLDTLSKQPQGFMSYDKLEEIAEKKGFHPDTFFDIVNNRNKGLVNTYIHLTKNIQSRQKTKYI